MHNFQLWASHCRRLHDSSGHWMREHRKLTSENWNPLVEVLKGGVQFRLTATESMFVGLH